VPKFRKKPIVVDAIQFKAYMEIDEICSFVTCDCSFNAEGENAISMEINTLEGDMQVNDGDWIVKGSFGEFWPVKKEIFEATYEKVDSNG
jgi:hypothetical protein